MPFSAINNYYEQLVFRQILDAVSDPFDENFLNDIALNHLPVKYAIDYVSQHHTDHSSQV